MRRLSKDGVEMKGILEAVLENRSMSVEGVDGYAKKRLIALVEDLLEEIMNKERDEYLLKSLEDKGNGSYKRSLNTSLGKLEIDVPRVRSNNFRPNILPDKYQRYDESFEDLIYTFLLMETQNKRLFIK